jgi:hypothetical protein
MFFNADPYIYTVLPLAGGDILIGAPLAPAAGFSSLLNSGKVKKECCIFFN